jgi:hypothetical protein
MKQTDSYLNSEKTESAIHWFALKQWQATGKIIHIPVQGRSMLPTLRDGDQVEMRLCPAANLTCGDIIGFFENDRITVHRLIMKKQVQGCRQYFQAGDNQTGWTGVPEDQVFGKVITIYRQDGRRTDLTRVLWTFLNPFLSYWAALGIFYAKLRAGVKKIAPGHRYGRMKRKVQDVYFKCTKRKI